MAIKAATPSQASQIEREAAKRIMESQKHVQNVAQEHAAAEEKINQDYEVSRSIQENNNVDALEKQKLVGYERVNKLKAEQQQEVARIKREGDKLINNMKEYYLDQSQQIEKTGDENIEKTVNQDVNQLELQKERAAVESKLADNEHRLQMETMKERSETAAQKLQDDSHAYYEKLHGTHEQAMKKSEGVFMDHFQKKVGEQAATLATINENARGVLDGMKEEYALKLAAYDDRAQDPFYRLVDVGARFDEFNDGYSISARIPPHERSSISVSVQGDHISLSGRRSNQEKLKSEDGTTKTSSSFQTYQQVFPISQPVNEKMIVRNFEGDTLTVWFPKQGVEQTRPLYKAPDVKKVKIERPVFPDNIQVASRDKPQQLPAKDVSKPGNEKVIEELLADNPPGQESLSRKLNS